MQKKRSRKRATNTAPHNMERIVYQGKIVEVVETEVKTGSGKKVFELARRSPGVRLIIPQNDSVLLTREYRYEINGYDYRLPGGKVFDTLTEYNEALLNAVSIEEAAERAAKKEALEETGLEVKTLSKFHKSVCGATVTWDLFYFVASDFTQKEQSLEDGEDIEVEWVPNTKVADMCLNGEIQEERSALVLLKYLKEVS